MQRLEVSGAVRPIYGSLGVKRLTSGFQGLDLPPPISRAVFWLEWIYQKYGGYGDMGESYLQDRESDI